MSFFEFPHTRTYDSDLGWIIREIKRLIDESDAIASWKIEVNDQLAKLEECCNDLMTGDFPEAFTNALISWMQNNALDIVGELIKMVFFGLENGYFVAYIPESWEDIIFNTSGLDIIVPDADFGHLVLSY